MTSAQNPPPWPSKTPNIIDLWSSSSSKFIVETRSRSSIGWFEANWFDSTCEIHGWSTNEYNFFGCGCLSDDVIRRCFLRMASNFLFLANFFDSRTSRKFSKNRTFSAAVALFSTNDSFVRNMAVTWEVQWNEIRLDLIVRQKGQLLVQGLDLVVDHRIRLLLHWNMILSFLDYGKTMMPDIDIVVHCNDHRVWSTRSNNRQSILNKKLYNNIEDVMSLSPMLAACSIYR